MLYDEEPIEGVPSKFCRKLDKKLITSWDGTTKRYNLKCVSYNCLIQLNYRGNTDVKIILYPYPDFISINFGQLIMGFETCVFLCGL